MKSVLRAFAVASLVLLVSPLPVVAADIALSEGTVKKIDKATHRIMLAHGPIANLGMPPMTMMFKVKDAALLQKVKDGDKVRFRVEDIDGDYTVVRIEAAK
jgi:Cu(I)/Ag(I) efflux system periplasmic protein CusF